MPASQQLLFAEAARAAGNRVGAIVFEGAPHGGGGLNSAAGRAAALRFLLAQGVVMARVEEEGGSSSAAASSASRFVHPDEYLRLQAAAFGTDQLPGYTAPLLPTTAPLRAQRPSHIDDDRRRMGYD